MKPREGNWLAQGHAIIELSEFGYSWPGQTNLCWIKETERRRADSECGRLGSSLVWTLYGQLPVSYTSSEFLRSRDAPTGRAGSLTASSRRAGKIARRSHSLQGPLPLHGVKLVHHHLSPSFPIHHLHLGFPGFCSEWPSFTILTRGPEPTHTTPWCIWEGGWPEARQSKMKCVSKVHENSLQQGWHVTKQQSDHGHSSRPPLKPHTHFSVWFLSGLKFFTFEIIFLLKYTAFPASLELWGFTAILGCTIFNQEGNSFGTVWVQWVSASHRQGPDSLSSQSVVTCSGYTAPRGLKMLWVQRWEELIML